MNKLKLILIGEGTVGKTSLINQYINNTFKEDYIMNVSADKSIKEIEIEKIKINLEIWDTPGQENYTSANKIFMKNTDIALIVYDITNRKSFEKLNFWINLVKEVNENRNLIIGIAANKSDLYENSEVNKEESEKYMSSIKDITNLFFETSAIDHENVENVFMELIKAYINEYGLKTKKEEKKNDENKASIQNNSSDNKTSITEMTETKKNNTNSSDYDIGGDNVLLEKDDKDCSSKCSII